MSESPANGAGPSQRKASASDPDVLRRFVLEYLQQHGYDKVVGSLKEGMTMVNDGEDGGPGKEAIFKASEPVPIEVALKRNIPQAQNFSASTLSDRITPEFETQAKYIIDMVTKKLGGKEGDEEPADAPERQDRIMDVSDRLEGYRRYRKWVDNGLDLWKPELDSLSYPIFAYTFLELMQQGFVKSAREFFSKYRDDHVVSHPQEIAALASVVDKEQIKNSQYCQRLTSERYIVAITRNTQNLLLQWLSGAGLEDEWENGLHSAAGRAKEAVKFIIHGHLKAQVSESALPLDEITIASSSGLLNSIHTGVSSQAVHSKPSQLKLGPVPMAQRLKEQVSRTLRDEDAAANGSLAEPNGSETAGENGPADEQTNGDGDVEMADGKESAAGTSGDDKEPAPVEVKLEPDLEVASDLVSPAENETNPPVPPLFQLSDLRREVEAVRDRRKMIRFGPNADEAKLGESSTAALPSVVAFTVFDGGEGVSSTEFSTDSSLMAVGSPESCIRIWSLKGEKLKAKSLDPTDGTLTEDEGLPMRKLIGHSGPVYSLSFDSVYGSSAPPQSLLSSSQDGTVRLWSLNTYSNLVVYRGHSREPVWDVEWGPLGVYFATGSRDRTARLWSSDRVTPLRMYTGHLSDVNCVKFHPNSLYLATGSNDTTCRLWDVQRGACIRLFLGHSDSITTMAISPDGRLLASAGLDRDIWLWDLGSSRPIKKMTGHRGAITSLSFSAESSILVSGGLDSTVRMWDVKSAGGERKISNGTIDRVNGVDGVGKSGNEAIEKVHGTIPMSNGDESRWDEGPTTADLLSTYHTKRTPVLKTHYTPRNLCMVSGVFVPPSNAEKA